MKLPQPIAQTLSGEWNPRFVRYARAHKTTPGAILALDQQIYPGGCMAGFINWIQTQWRTWEKETGHPEPHGPADHAQFDAWLARRHP